MYIKRIRFSLRDKNIIISIRILAAGGFHKTRIKITVDKMTAFPQYVFR